MMKAANHFKLGLFVVIALVAVVATSVGLGAKALDRDTLEYHTYFDESVQGLEIGAPVKFRGVTVGSVQSIDIAPDNRHVEVVAEIAVDVARRIGLAEPERADRALRPVVGEDLRAQLGSQGLTGVKYLLIDSFDPAEAPAPSLPFVAAQPYIPATPSFFKNVEDVLVASLDDLPEVTERTRAVITRLDETLDDFDRKGVPDDAAAAVADASVALRDLREIVKTTRGEKLPEKASVALANLDGAVKKMDGVLKRVDGDDGLVASAHRATDALALTGKNANGTIRRADASIASLGEAAEAIRDLAEVLEREPDMLVKGRERKEEP